MSGQQADNHQPGPKWEFNEDVAASFDDMLGRSIPGYRQMRELAFDLGKRFIRSERCNIIDLGASRGESVSAFIESKDLSDAQFFLTEVSQPMIDQINERWSQRSNVHACNFDLRKKHDEIRKAIRQPITFMGAEPWTIQDEQMSVAKAAYSTTLVQAILTLIFVPINFRQAILKGVHDGLAPGGAFIMVEKVLGDSAEMQDLMVDAYHEHKNRHGYRWEDIERKRASLEGVQVPLRHEENVAMLRSAGFRNVDTFWRHLNFVGYICIKD